MKTNIKIIAPLLVFLTSALQGATFAPFPTAPQIEYGKEVPYFGEQVTEENEWENPFGVNAFDIRGNISTLGVLGANDTIVIKVYNSLTGEVVYSSTPNADGNYMAYIPEVTSGSIIYNVKIETVIGGVAQDYFVDFGTQDNDFAMSYKEAQQIVWQKNSSGVDIAQDLNGLELNVNTPNSFISYNLSEVNNNKFIVNGKVKVSDTFTFGTIKVVAINTSNAKEYSFYTQTTPLADEPNTYPFELKLLNDHNDYIIKIVTQDDKTLELNEMYYNYGSDHQESSDDQIVGMQNIDWVETSEGSNLWIPDLEKTSYLHIDDNFSLYSAIDSTMYGKTDYKISGTIRTRLDEYKYPTSNALTVSVFDANNGKLLDSSRAVCDDTFTYCTYDLNIGSILNNVNDSGNSGYIFKIDERISYVNKSYYYDYGDDNLDNSGDEALKASIRVDINNGVPDVNNLQISQLETLSDIDMAAYVAPKEYGISGKFVDVDPLTSYIRILYREPKLGLYVFESAFKNDDGTFSFTKPDLEEGNYVITITQVKTLENGLNQSFEYILDDEDMDGDYSSGAVIRQKSDIAYSAYDVNGVNLDDKKYDSTFDTSLISYYVPQVNLVSLDRDMTIPTLSLVPPPVYNYTLNLDNLTKMDGKTVEIELREEGSFKRYYKTLTIDESTEVISFDNVKKSNYFFSLKDAKQEFFLSNGELIEGVYKVGYQNSEVCWDYTKGIDSCDWSSLIQMVNTYKDEKFEPFEISSDTTANIVYPAKNLLKMTLKLGIDNANIPVSIGSQKRTNKSAYNSYSFQTDDAGDLYAEIPADGNNDYTLSVSVGYDHFSIKEDGGDYTLVKLATIYNKADNYSIHPFALHTTDDTDLAMGDVELPVLRDVTMRFTNLVENESNDIVERVMVSIIGANGYFSSLNLEPGSLNYTDTVKFTIPDGDYKIKISPSKNYSGFVDVDGNGSGDSSITDIDFVNGGAKYTWIESNSDTLTVGDNTVINVTLKSLDSYKKLSGIVNLGAGDIEAGWICAKSGTDGKCTIVSSDGSFEINPLSPTGDYTYLVEYRSNSGEMIRQKVTMTNGEDLIDADIQTIKVTVAGNVQDTNNDIKEIVLIEVDDDETGKWTIIKSIAVSDTSSSVEFSFSNMPEALSGTHYEVGVASIVIDTITGVATYTIRNSVKSDNTAGSANGVVVDDAVTLEINQ